MTKSIIIFLLLLLLTTITEAQETKFFTWWKLAQVGTAFGSGYASGYADYYDMRKGDSTGQEMTDFDKKYHRLQFVERSLLFSAGVTIPLNSKLKPAQTLSDVLLSGFTWGLAHTIGQNVARDKPWLWQSEYQKKNNTGGFEQISYEWYAVGFFVTLALNYIVYELLL